ncbi:Mediator of RNA polymerase II transcription subunit 21 [Capsicum chinense]|nr:Mediator of RNA polymerase II transcription subunit 21 [Capsicum chinense]
MDGASSILSKLSMVHTSRLVVLGLISMDGSAIATLIFNTFGTLQREAPPVRLSPNYPEPPLVNPTKDSTNVAEQPKQMSTTFIKAAKQLVAALPLSDGVKKPNLRELQNSRMRMMQLAKNFKNNWKLQFGDVEKELKQVQELFNQATDNYLNLKKPE